MSTTAAARARCRPRAMLPSGARSAARSTRRRLAGGMVSSGATGGSAKPARVRAPRSNAALSMPPGSA